METREDGNLVEIIVTIHEAHGFEYGVVKKVPAEEVEVGDQGWGRWVPKSLVVQE